MSHLLSDAPGGIRTPNRLIRSQVLYPLSYRRKNREQQKRSLPYTGGRTLRLLRYHIRAILSIVFLRESLCLIKNPMQLTAFPFSRNNYSNHPYLLALLLPA